MSSSSAGIIIKSLISNNFLWNYFLRSYMYSTAPSTLFCLGYLLLFPILHILQNFLSSLVWIQWIHPCCYYSLYLNSLVSILSELWLSDFVIVVVILLLLTKERCKLLNKKIWPLLSNPMSISCYIIVDIFAKSNRTPQFWQAGICRKLYFTFITSISHSKRISTLLWFIYKSSIAKHKYQFFMAYVLSGYWIYENKIMFIKFRRQ